MRILCTNDDGILAYGLECLVRAASQIGSVTIVAPDREQSAPSHSLTLHHPLRPVARGPGRFQVDGTPTDCVMLAVEALMPERPDFVQVHLREGRAMDGGLGFAQPGKQFLGAILPRLAQRRTVNQTVDVIERPVHQVMLFLVRLRVDMTMALVMMAMIVFMVVTVVAATTVVVGMVQRSVLSLDAELCGRNAGPRDPLGPDSGW